MATTVRSLLNRAAALLSDEEFVRWEEAELLEWLNDGQTAIARGPATDVYVLRDTFDCVAGTVQDMPNDNIRLVDVVRNIEIRDEQGTVINPGNAILQADKAIADVLQADWRTAASGLAENYFYDERNPDQFELYPPQSGGEQIEIIYNADPPPSTITGALRINDVYADAILDYMVYRALSKDTEDTATEIRKADRYYQSFLMGAGFRDATDAQIEPWRS
jgi:hypothetical protein